MRRPDSGILLELFATANLAFLALDVFLAHAANGFRNGAEWIPVIASGLAGLALGANLLIRRPFDRGAGKWLGWIAGGLAIAVGVAGLLWHLESQFFQERTLRSLVYSAPFIAPLAFTGIGFLLLLNRLVPRDDPAWARWVLALAWGGFLGDFLLSLADHAQNGFFYGVEWVAVGASALAVGYFLVFLLVRPTSGLILGGWLVLALQALTGVAGWLLHLGPALSSAGSLRYRVLYGPPVFAPLLFTNLAVLGAIGLGAVARRRS